MRKPPKVPYEPGIANFIDDIRDVARSSNGFVLEIGVGKGDGSSQAIEEGLEERGGDDRLYISVDWQDYMEIKPDVSYWQMIIGDSRSIDTAMDVLRTAGNRRPGVIFIDTHHTYEQMVRELFVWGPVVDTQTVWLFHDTWMFGVWNEMNEAIKEFAAASHSASHRGGWVFEDFRPVPHGLGRMRWQSE